jgi:hypothetical protein
MNLATAPFLLNQTIKSMKSSNLVLVILFLFQITTAHSQNSSNNTHADTIFQCYYRADNKEASDKEALVGLAVTDFQKNPLPNMPLWVWDKKNNQYWQGKTDERGEVFFLLPVNQAYTVNLNGESDYRKFTIPKEKKLSKTFKVVCMSTRISETERNDTIFQQLAPGQMPTMEKVLVQIKLFDFDNNPLPGERMFYVAKKTKKVYVAVSDRQGRATLMLPKGDTYVVNSEVFPAITSKTYEDRPSSRTSTLELQTFSTAEFKRRELERARFLAQRDSILAVQRSRDSQQLANRPDINFYLQHFYGKGDFQQLEKRVLEVVQKEQTAIKGDPNYYQTNGQEIKAMLHRNKAQWKEKRIIANIDCSMYQYIDELLVWNYTDEQEKNGNHYWLFNGFQNKHKGIVDDHHRRGIYQVQQNNVEGFCKTIDKIVNFQCGGNRLENVVEALTIGAQGMRPEEELLFIADNYSDVSDLHRLNELTQPVNVLLTASTYGINEQYLEIAYRTGGSVHTNYEDIPKEKLQSLQDGERLKIGIHQYRFMKGRFLKC